MQIPTQIRIALISAVLFLISSYLISQDLRPFYVPWIIHHQANAWSSAFYALVPAPLVLIKLPMMTLAVVSFGLWSNSTPLVNFIDVTSIFWVIIIVTLYILPIAPYKVPVVYSINGLFATYICAIIGTGYHTQVLAYYHENLVPITGTILFISTVTLTSHYGATRIYIIGSGCVMLGFACKLLTIYVDQYWGTCVFHTSTALGIAILLRLMDDEQAQCKKPILYIRREPYATMV